MWRNITLYALTLASTVSLIPEMALAVTENPQEAASNFLDLSLQQLSDIEITSVSKKVEKESQAAAAIYVITQEDIRRSGLQSVPELLRMVPGLQVAQSGAQGWAITSRGNNGQFANRLLVLVDGRTVFTPIFSGVWWDEQNLMLEDIERIEVIRGPGATLWGANAVNGVINIISKSAKDTQGTLLTGAVGNQTRVNTGGRYGGRSGDFAYRTYAQYFNKNQEHTVANATSGATAGAGAQDQWYNAQGGFRFDWGASDKEMATLQGDAYKGTEHALRYLPVTAAVNPSLLNIVRDTEEVSGMNILGRWKHELSSGSDITLQTYYDDVNRKAKYVGSSFHTQTFDVDFQHNLTLNSYNDITWGLAYRYINSGSDGGFYIRFTPENFYENLFSVFVQDKVTLMPDKLFLTFGSKLEHNDFSGFEWEPSARIAWTPTSNQTVWAAVSRAVRAPVQGDQNQSIVGAILSGDIAVVQTGTPYATANVVVAYELGYRIQPQKNVSLDVTGFVNEYKRSDSFAQGDFSAGFDPVMGAYTQLSELSTNDNRAETHGIEISGGYTLYYESIHTVGSLSPKEGTAPKQQFSLRSYVDLPHNVQWDSMLYYVGTLPAVGDGFGNTISIPAYTRLDMRLGWEVTPGVDLSLVGQNLLQSQHEEFSPFLYQTPEEISRSFFAKATARF
jgi:iron complex outermembrane receptor protein